jgi:hypothetical protein
VYSLQLLLALASAVILRSESSGSRDHILLSQIRDSTELVVETYVRPTVSRPVCLGIKHPSGAHNQFFFFYCQTFAGLLMWGALSDERTSLSFTITSYPVITSQHVENTVTNNSPIVACVSVAAGICLPSRSLAAAVYSCFLKYVA